MDWEFLHKPDNSKPVCFISKESSCLMSDRELIGLLKMRGIDTTRKTRIDKYGAVFYND